MLYESQTWQVRRSDGVLHGIAQGRLSWAAWPELVAVLARHVTHPAIQLVLVEASFDFSEVLAEQTEREACWSLGLNLLQQWQALPVPTVGVATESARGLAWEWLQLFDLRLAIATPTSRIEVPTHPAWVDPVTNQAERNLTPREAVRCQLLDDAYTARRANIELRLHLDRLLAHPRLSVHRCRWRAANAWPLRLPFIQASHEASEETTLALTSIPSTRPTKIALFDASELGVRLVAEHLLRGGQVVVLQQEVADEVARMLQAAVSRGRVTPLEAEQAQKQLRVDTDGSGLISARWVLTRDQAKVEFLRPRLHPWVKISEYGRADAVAPAWAASLGLRWLAPQSRSYYAQPASVTNMAS